VLRKDLAASLPRHRSTLEFRAESNAAKAPLERCASLVEAPAARVRCEFRWRSKLDMYQLNEMSLDELWRLHEAIVAELSRKMTAEKVRLEERLRKIDPDALSRSARRKDGA
jgi:hypothetical protein